MAGLEFLRNKMLYLFVKEAIYSLLHRDPPTTIGDLHKKFRKATGSTVTYETFKGWLKELELVPRVTVTFAARVVEGEPVPRTTLPMDDVNRPVVAPVPERAPDPQMTLWDRDVFAQVPVIPAGGGSPSRKPALVPGIGGIMEASDVD